MTHRHQSGSHRRRRVPTAEIAYQLFIQSTKDGMGLEERNLPEGIKQRRRNAYEAILASLKEPGNHKLEQEAAFSLVYSVGAEIREGYFTIDQFIDSLPNRKVAKRVRKYLELELKEDDDTRTP